MAERYNSITKFKDGGRMEKRVLFVDDEKSVLAIMENLFGLHGYLPRCTLDPLEALAIVKKEGIRVCFVDLRMPAMDGLELCRRIKQIDPSAHVFALSAYMDAYRPEQYTEAGFSACFHKPFKIDELLGACRRAFAKLGSLDTSRAAEPAQDEPPVPPRDAGT
jgi:CheY-like chemotaxis protein